ncbi:MAG TPA: diacylglycerol kinase [Gammaproteobacteria bacterium]
MTLAKPRNTGLRRVFDATLFSLAGLRAAWLHEPAFRQECIAAAFLIPAAAWVGTSAVEKLMLIGSCLLVLIVELLNSAVEAAVDRVGTDRHLLAARAKDLGSAAVFMSLVLAAVVWGVLLWERLR